jgi:hypothetical protein
MNIYLQEGESITIRSIAQMPPSHSVTSEPRQLLASYPSQLRVSLAFKEIHLQILAERHAGTV